MRLRSIVLPTVGCSAVAALVDYGALWLFFGGCALPFSRAAEAIVVYVSGGLALICSSPLALFLGLKPDTDRIAWCVFGAILWAVTGFVIGILGELRRQGRKTLIRPWWIALSGIPILVIVVALALLASWRPGRGPEPPHLLGIAWFWLSVFSLTALPQFLALVCLASALIRKPQRPSV